MKENSKPITDMQQLAEMGWMQMQEMLRQHDVGAKAAVLEPSSKKRNFFPLFAVGILVILIFSFPFILNNHFPFSSITELKTGNTPFVRQSQNNISPSKAPETVSQEKILLRQKLKSDYLKFREKDALVLNKTRNEIFIQPATYVQSASETNAQITTPLIFEQLRTVLKPDTGDSSSAQKKSRTPVFKKIRIFGGAGINLPVSIENPLNTFDHINIHPGVKVSFPLTKKLSLHSGLYAFSTVHGKEMSAKEKELVNSASTNIYYNINTTSIVKATYFDVPVTIHYSLNKNWSVGSGFQLSRLYKMNIKEKKESFDYNNSPFLTTVGMYNSTPSRAAAVFQEKAEIKKYESRLVTEVNFSQDRWLLSAGYYYGLGKTITLKDADNTRRQFRNEYFKLGIQYRITGKQ